MPCSLSLKQVMSSSCRSAGLAMVVNVNSLFNGWLNFLFGGKIERCFKQEWKIYKTECLSKRFGLVLLFFCRVSVQEVERNNVNVPSSWNM